MAMILTLGEIMLRLSTATGQRLNTSQSLAMDYGGGEANVAISLANYGHDVAFASKIPNNALGKSVTQHLHQYGVDTTHLLVGGPRLGTYYVESGGGVRGAAVIYDRAHSSFAETDLIEFGTDLFKGVTLFHISGVTPALSEAWATQTIALVQAAKQAGCQVSFDCNFRSNLWDRQQAAQVFAEILPFVDYCSAGELDARYLFDIPEQPHASVAYYYEQLHHLFPTIRYFYSTKRTVHSCEHHELQGSVWSTSGVTCSKVYDILAINDRIGGGDAFSAGFLHGIMSGKTPQEAIEFATAAGVLKHTVSGDCNQFSTAEVEQFQRSDGAGKIIR